jgi:hypothetical protein
MKITKYLGLTICMLLLAGIFFGCLVQPVRAMVDNTDWQQTKALDQAQSTEQIIMSTKYPTYQVRQQRNSLSMWNWDMQVEQKRSM